MKKILYLLFLVALTISKSYAQSTSSFSENAKWTELTQSKRAVAPIVIGKSNSDFFLINTIKKKTYLQKYNLNTLSLKSSKEIILEFKGKNLELVNTFIANDTPILITSFFNKKTRKKYLFYHTINPKSLTISVPKLMGDKFIPKKSGYLASQALSGIYLTSSKDEMSSFLAYPKSNAAAEDIEVQNRDFIGKFFDENFSETSKSEFKIPFENFQIREYNLSNEGVFHLLLDKLVGNPEASKKLFRGSKFLIESTHLLIIDAETGESEIFEIEIEEENISKLTVTPLQNGGISVTGLTSDVGGVNGTFSILFDNEFVEVNNSVHKFEPDFITATWSSKAKAKVEKKNKKKEKKGKEKIKPAFYNYYIDHVIELSDGSVTMLAEQYYVRVVTRTSTVNGQTTTTTTYYYYYNDIIAVNYDNTGEFRWKKLIRKHQLSVNDGGYYSSYFVVEQEDNINIIYNEGLTAVKVNLDIEGEVEKENIIQFTEEKRMKLVPKNCGDMGDGSLFLYARGKKGGKLGTLNLNK
jgi:hypothetical protein